MKTKEEYKAPELTVVSFKVEQGFTASGPLFDLRLWEMGIGEDDVEDYSVHDSWHQSDGFWD